MKLSRTNKLLTAALVTSLATSVAVAADAPKNYNDYDLKGKPNVLVISVDDLGYGQINIDESAFNKAELEKYWVPDRYKTSVDKAINAAKKSSPTLRKLQDSGIALTQAFVSHAVSGPSRAAFMTGRFPSTIGILSNEDAEVGAANNGYFLPKLFQEYGYNTAAIGKYHLGNIVNVPVTWRAKTRDYHDNTTKFVTDDTQPQLNGFKYFFGIHGSGAAYYDSPAIFENRHNVKAEGYITDQLTDKALAQINKSKGEPFFIYLAYNAPHIPLEQHAPKKYRIFNTGNEEVDKYYESIYAVDQNVNRIIKQLKANGQYDNTIILFWSDNGAVMDSPLPLNGQFSNGNKGMVFNGGVHVPAFISWPKGLKAGTKYNEMVGTLDLMPTVLEAAGIPIPEKVQKDLDGVSLLPYLTGAKQGTPRDYLYWVQPRAYHWNEANKEFWKNYDAYVMYKSDETPKPSPNIEKKSDFAYAIRDNEYTLHYYAKDKSYELYDLKNDPHERNNLINEKPEVATKLKKQMLEFINKKVVTPATQLNADKFNTFKAELNK